jgi:hypothetical protein
MFTHPTSHELLVAEGVETALAAGELDGWRRSTWSAISTSGLAALQVPKEFTTIVIAADKDANGPGERAARVLAHRLRKQGRRARIIAPAKVGTDWNDTLIENKARGSAA